MKESNFEFCPPVKDSNSNVTWSNYSVSFDLLSFSTASSKSLVLSLKVSDSFLIVWSTSGKICCNCSDSCFCPIGSRLDLFGVIEIELLELSAILVTGLEKLSTSGLLGSGAICLLGSDASLFLKGEKLPSENKKLVSLGSDGCGTNFERGGKSRL